MTIFIKQIQRFANKHNLLCKEKLDFQRENAEVWTNINCETHVPFYEETWLDFLTNACWQIFSQIQLSNFLFQNSNPGDNVLIRQQEKQEQQTTLDTRGGGKSHMFKSQVPTIKSQASLKSLYKQIKQVKSVAHLKQVKSSPDKCQVKSESESESE